jgi:hypothetical protein
MYYEVKYKFTEIWKEIKALTKSYEDGIIDCLKAVEKYKLSGIYDVPIRYIEEAIIKLLPSGHIINLTDISDVPG